MRVLSFFRSRMENALHDRDPAIDFIRGFAILSVVMVHFAMTYLASVNPEPRIFSFHYWYLLSRNGYFGVSAFFVISGYLITGGALQRYGQLKRVPFFDFYVFRVARIVPPLLMLVGVNFILDLFIEKPIFFYHSSEFTFWEWLRALFVLDGDGSRNVKDLSVGFSLGVTWSLLVEECFYLVFPILCRVLRHHALIAVAFIGLMINAVYYRMAVGYPHGFFSYSGCFDLLALGGLVALFRHTYPRAALALQSKWLGYASLISLFGVYLSWHDRDIVVWGPLGIGFSVAGYILSAKPMNKHALQSGFTRAMRLLGVYSYEVYLSHIVVGQLLALYLFDWLDRETALAGAIDLYFLTYFSTTLAVSFLFSELYSEPARRLIKKVAFAARLRISLKRTPPSLEAALSPEELLKKSS